MTKTWLALKSLQASNKNVFGLESASKSLPLSLSLSNRNVALVTLFYSKVRRLIVLYWIITFRACCCRLPRIPKTLQKSCLFFAIFLDVILLILKRDCLNEKQLSLCSFQEDIYCTEFESGAALSMWSFHYHIFTEALNNKCRLDILLVF